MKYMRAILVISLASVLLLACQKSEQGSQFADQYRSAHEKADALTLLTPKNYEESKILYVLIEDLSELEAPDKLKAVHDSYLRWLQILMQATDAAIAFEGMLGEVLDVIDQDLSAEMVCVYEALLLRKRSEDEQISIRIAHQELCRTYRLANRNARDHQVQIEDELEVIICGESSLESTLWWQTGKC